MRTNEELALSKVIREVRDEFLARMSGVGVLISDVVDPRGIVVKTRRSHNARAYDINCGFCEDFAETVCRRFNNGPNYAGVRDYAVAEWVDEEKYDSVSHCVVCYGGRFYDAEVPDGVDSPDDLPCVRHLEQTREEALRMTGEWDEADAPSRNDYGPGKMESYSPAETANVVASLLAANFTTP